MKRIAMIGLFAALTGCASSAPKSEPSGLDTPSAVSEPEPKPADSSDVLARKDPNAPKCPKKAKLVKGKCMLQVEETE